MHKDGPYWHIRYQNDVYTVDDYGNLVAADLFPHNWQEEYWPTWDFVKLAWLD